MWMLSSSVPVFRRRRHTVVRLFLKVVLAWLSFVFRQSYRRSAGANLAGLPNTSSVFGSRLSLRSEFVGWLLAYRLSNMLVHLRDGSAPTILRAATQIAVADRTFFLTQSQYTDPGLCSPSADPIKQSTWQGSHSSATGMTRHGTIHTAPVGL